MKRPHFLVIGGMKCGSTTLYYDLDAGDDVYFPIDKEPENLTRDHVLTDEGRRDYARLFARARHDQRLGEASTAYTKRPVFEGVAERARAVCGPDLRVVYAVREPVARVVSHHHHARVAGDPLPGGGAVPDDLSAALEVMPELIDFCRYAHQVRPWIEALGRDRVLIVRFERYMSAREEWARRVRTHVGARAEARPAADRAFNASDGKPVVTGPWKLVHSNPVYRRLIRPMLTQGFKDRVRHALLPKTRVRKASPTGADIERIYAALAEDHDELAAFLGEPGPVWSEAAARAKHLEGEPA